MTIDDLGNIGEGRFREWCRLSSLVINSSVEQDATGWDYKVELSEILQDKNNISIFNPENSFSHNTFDIQVKTTLNDDKNSWQIRLDHLIRTINTSNPAFICIIQYDEKSQEVKGVYFIHVGKDIMYKILKRHRKLLAQNKELTNKMTMLIKAEKEDFISNEFHKDIKKRMLEVIDGNFKTYAKNKAELLEKLGYDGMDNLIKFNVKLEDIMEHSLGLKKDLDVNKVFMTDNRFKIPIEKEMGDAKLTIMPEGQKAKMKIVTDKQDVFTYDVEVRKTPFNVEVKNLNDKQNFSVISHEAFNIAVSKSEINILPKTYDNYPYEHAKIYFQVAQALLNNPSVTLYSDNNKKPISLNNFFHKDQTKSNPMLFKYSVEVCKILDIENIFIDNIDYYTFMKQASNMEYIYMFYHKKLNGELSLSGSFDVEIEYSNLLFPFYIGLNLGKDIIAFFFIVDNLSKLKEPKIEDGIELLTIGTNDPNKDSMFIGCKKYSIEDINEEQIHDTIYKDCSELVLDKFPTKSLLYAKNDNEADSNNIFQLPL